MRVAFVMNLAPRKRGSFEDWILAACRETRWRGHAPSVYTRAPVHPEVERALLDMRVPWHDLEEVERAPASTAHRWARGLDVIHLSFVAPRSRLAAVAYAAWPASVLYVAHTDYEPPSGALPKRALRAAVDSVSLLRVEALAGVSRHTAEREARRFGVPPGRTVTLYNGVDTKRFHPPVERAGGPRPRLFTVAYLVLDKQIDRLLRAAAVLERDFSFAIAGDGPDLPRLQSLAAAWGLADRVTFLGLRNDVEVLLRESDVFLHAARHESFGLAIAEAMASGLGVVASAVGGVPELVEHGVSGLLVPPDDDDGLVRAVRALCDRPDLRRALGEGARERIRLHFALQQSAIHHVDWCEAAAARGLKAQVRSSLPVPQSPAAVPLPELRREMPAPQPDEEARPEA